MPVNKARNIAAEQRRTVVLQLKVGGATERAIATKVGVSLSQVAKDLKRRLWEIRSLDKEAADALWKIQSARYERLLLRWWPVAIGDTEEAAVATDRVLAILTRLDRIGGILPEKPTYNFIQDNRQVSFRVVYDDGAPGAIEAAPFSANGREPEPGEA